MEFNTFNCNILLLLQYYIMRTGTNRFDGLTSLNQLKAAGEWICDARGRDATTRIINIKRK